MKISHWLFYFIKDLARQTVKSHWNNGIVQVEKMQARDPVQKEMATQKKEQKKTQAELEKEAARAHNVVAKQAEKTGAHDARYIASGTGTTATYPTTGATGHPTGTHPMSALPGHGTGQPAGQVTEGVMGSHPIGTHTAGTGRTTAHDPRLEGTDPGYGTGGTY